MTTRLAVLPGRARPEEVLALAPAVATRPPAAAERGLEGTMTRGGESEVPLKTDSLDHTTRVLCRIGEALDERDHLQQRGRNDRGGAAQEKEFLWWRE